MTLERDGTTFVGACSCDLRYRSSQPPILVDLKPPLTHSDRVTASG